MRHDALLIAAPILAHTRYAIPSGALKPELAQTLAVHLQAHGAGNTQTQCGAVAVPVQHRPAPRAPIATPSLLTHKLASAALVGTVPKVDLRDLPETALILADPRYLLAVVVAPHEGALFRCWQEDAKEHHAERSTCLEQWRQQV